MKANKAILISFFLLPLLVSGQENSATLETIKTRGTVICGAMEGGLAGFSMPDDKNHWTGIDADFCRAIAAAIFGDINKTKFMPLTGKERFTALQTGEIDVLSRSTR